MDNKNNKAKDVNKEFFKEEINDTKINNKVEEANNTRQENIINEPIIEKEKTIIRECKIQEMLNDKIIVNLNGFRISLDNKGFKINDIVKLELDKNNNIINYQK